MAAPWTPAASNVSYPAGVGTVAATERCNVFLPDGSAPSGGWPVLLWIEETALNAGALQTSIASGTSIAHQCLARGVAFVSATVAHVGAGLSGDGLYTIPGSADWNLGTKPNAWKSAIHLVEWAKGYASFSAAKVCIGGELIGADLALWAGAGPDWTAIGGAAQFRSGVTARAAGVVALRPTAWFPGVVITTPCVGFSENGAPGTAAAEFGDVDSADLVSASPMSALFDDTAYPGVRALTAAQPLFTWASGARSSSDFTKSAQLPTIANVLALGDAWGAQALRRDAHPLNATFHRRRSTALQAARYADPASLPTEILARDADVYGRAAQWVLGAVGDAPPLEPVVERLTRNLMAQLLTPTAGASYFTTVHDVRRGPAVFPSKVASDSVVYVTALGSDTAGYGRDKVSAILSTARCEVVGLIQSAASDAPSQAEQLARDLEAAIYTDRTLGGLATEVVVTERTPLLAADGQQPIAGAQLDVEIRYQTETTDLLTHR